MSSISDNSHPEDGDKRRGIETNQNECNRKLKRSRTEKDNSLNEEDDDTTKTRYDENNAQSKLRANNNNNNKFMNVHLHVLMSLYQKDSTISILRHDHDDCPAVEEKYWELIKYFLKQRCAIKTTTERVQCMSEICDQAVEFGTNVLALPISENEFLGQQVSPQMNHTAHRKSSMKGSRSSNVSFRSSSSAHNNMLITQPSPFLNRSSHARSWTNGTTCKSSVPSKNSGYIQECDNLEMAGGNAFGIVSGLLKYRRQLASKQLNQRYSTLHALVKESQTRIVNLNSRIRNAIEETNEDTKVEIETKIGLWKLLLRDLTETLS
jgi:hypothetical protein